ncbi:MAG: hypothetical protein GY866_08180 [Proteobacteria bacterium]|nr:hypothetical protein [Pseudomonadota bacterium]
METALETFKRQICNNDVSRYYFDQLTGGNDAEILHELGALLERNVVRYTSIRALQPLVRKSTEPNPEIRTVVDAFPSFVFRIGCEWSQNPNYYDSAKKLMLAGINTLISKDPDGLDHIDPFINDIDPEADRKNLNASLINKADEDAYLPQKVFGDFVFVAKNRIRFRSTRNLNELIENLFFFEGTSQVFLAYYFDLLCRVPSDSAAEHIHLMFSRLFLSLGQTEVNYWGNYSHKDSLLERLLSTIDRDLPHLGHPKLKKSVFEKTKTFNPIAQNQTSPQATSSFQRKQTAKLEAIHSFSPVKLALFLDTILKYKGKTSVNAFLLRIARANKDRLSDLFDFLRVGENRIYDELGQAVAQLVGKSDSLDKTTNHPKTPVPSVLRTDETVRTKAAKTKLSASQGKRGMTQDQVADYLKEYFVKMFERAKIEGAMTQDDIQPYLVRLANTAAEALARTPMDRKIIDDFAESVAPDLKEISEKNPLTPEDIEAQTQSIRRKAEDHAEQLKEPPPSPEIPKETNDFMAGEIVPIGFEKGAPKISAETFFRFPLGPPNGPPENDWFAQHVRYLKSAAEISALPRPDLDKIFDLLPDLPQTKYRKYFDIFPNNDFDDAVLTVVYGLWQNNAFKHLIRE